MAGTARPRNADLRTNGARASWRISPELSGAESPHDAIEQLETHDVGGIVGTAWRLCSWPGGRRIEPELLVHGCINIQAAALVMETDLHDRDFARLWKAEDHAPSRCQAGQMRTAKLVDAWPGESVLTGAAAHALEFAFVAQEADPRFDKAAARWIGRLLVETPPLTLPETRWVVAMVEQLPRCRESLHRFARRR